MAGSASVSRSLLGRCTGQVNHKLTTDLSLAKEAASGSCFPAHGPGFCLSLVPKLGMDVRAGGEKWGRAELLCTWFKDSQFIADGRGGSKLCLKRSKDNRWERFSLETGQHQNMRPLGRGRRRGIASTLEQGGTNLWPKTTPPGFQNPESLILAWLLFTRCSH